MKAQDFYHSLTTEAQEAIYGVVVPIRQEFATCAKGIGPYGCGICKHPECFEYEYSHLKARK